MKKHSKTGPEDCALAIGIPTTRRKFERAAADQKREFVREVAVPVFSPFLDPDEAWRNGYAAFANRVENVADAVSRLGVTVREDAGLADVKQLLKRFRVVTIVGHATARLLSPSDILDASRLLDRLKELRQLEVPAESAALEAIQRDEELCSSSSVADFLKRVNLRIRLDQHDCARRGEGATPWDEETEDNVGWSALRVFEAFPAWVRPPSVLELGDGISDFEKVVASVPPAFSGILEFRLCCARSFAEPLRRRRPGCEDILFPKQPAWFRERLSLYEQQIQVLARRPCRYSEVAAWINRAALVWLGDSRATNGTLPETPACNHSASRNGSSSFISVMPLVPARIPAQPWG
jgi:hypothetical protein